ncbi:OmpH family outer membrane protein [Fulvivirga sediminis]|uniref:OmpH family outer membrane protein n=1 Tax=Fulvivirga sediminis TaxID=2803949 RepID=A0A937F4U5_9BACT|nr:OmpH family outer membrane protein [Fulvivirga sediminis]MBL3654907.1 OmpH family outer membrane protein [Fulvivirga sediminis]
MKNKLFLTIIAFAFIGLATVQAQTTKIAYADVDYILSQMPEAKQVESDLKAHNTQLQNQLQAKYQEYQEKLQAYQQGASTMDAAIRQDKETELAQLEQRIQKFQQDAQNSMQKKQADLMQPLYEKVGNNIESVAKENGYTYVLNGQIAGVDVVLYADSKFDISDLVLKKMGVTPSGK